MAAVRRVARNQLAAVFEVQMTAADPGLKRGSF
jgi:hypothetical protein